jgi:lipid-binding SYLF domain-containing protein
MMPDVKRLRAVALASVLAAATTVAAPPSQAAEAATPPAAADEADKSAAKRAKIDKQAKQTLDKLLRESSNARALHEKAYGYAIFDARKTSFMMAGGGGKGVAVAKASGERTYMKMASVGFNFGAGIKFYSIVFLFEDAASFRRFVDDGWEAGAGANAVAGQEAANLAASFVNGMAIFELSDKGLMLSVDVSGTKYWKPESLNEL